MRCSIQIFVRTFCGDPFFLAGRTLLEFPAAFALVGDAFAADGFSFPEAARDPAPPLPREALEAQPVAWLIAYTYRE